MSGRGGVRGLLRRLTAPEDELDAEDLSRARADAGLSPVCDCPRGRVVTLSGRLRSVQYCPRTNLPALEAELFDGSGSVTLVWLGRRRIPGIEPGRSLVVSGRLALRGAEKVLYNPTYTLEPTGP